MENNIPKDILDAVNNVLDKRLKYAIKRLVRVDTPKQDKEGKVVAFTSSRLFVLPARVPSKIEQSIHYFSIRRIESKKPNQLVIVLEDEGKSNENKSLNFRTINADTEEVNAMITHIGVSLKQVFPNIPLEKLIKVIDVNPTDRLNKMYATLKELEAKDVGPCGGFSQMYNFMCDYHSVVVKEEVTWDVDTIYLSSGTKELSLGDFDHLDNKDLTPIISSLRHNPWFTVINSNGTKLVTDNMNELIKVMKKNKVIEELHIAGVGVKFEFANRLSTALLSNSASPFHTLDISGNQIEDRGIIHLASPLGKLSRGVVSLNLARCNLTPRGINRLAESLGSNKFTSSTLTKLSLAGNSLRGDEITSICNFLAQPNAIVKLDLSDTECALDLLCGALLRGCTQSLSHVNLSGNVFSNKKVREVAVPPAWKQFFTSAMSLQKVNLSNCRIPADALKALLAGIANNRNIHELDLDISSNEFRTPGATVIQSMIAEINNITSLNISDNGFDVDLIGILGWIARNKSIQDLSIGKNFSNIRARSSSSAPKRKPSPSSNETEEHVSQVLESVVQLIQEDNSRIQSLSLAGSKLKGDLALLINALGSNTSLTKLDISGNSMGDYGARMLAKALQINTKLQTICWDHNSTSAQGFQDIANALKNNYTLKYMPTPVCDASKNNSEKAQAALEKIESLLHRNHSPRKFNSDKSFRLQHGFLISSTQQMVDRLVLQIQETISALGDDTNTETAAKVEEAKKIIRDAENSKHLLLKLQEVALVSEERGSGLDSTLSSMTDDLKKVLEYQLDRNLKDMLNSAEEQCPTVMEADEESKEEIKKACEEKSTLPKNYVKGLIIHQAGTDMFNKMSEINLTVAAYMSDRIIDGVLEQLTSCQRNLVDCLNSMISSKPDIKVTSDKKENKDTFIIEKEAEIREERDPSTKLTDKRRSYHSRRVRPQSIIDPQTNDLGYDLDMHAVEKHLHEVEEKEVRKPEGKRDKPDGKVSEKADDSSDFFGDLPPIATQQKLECVTKSRPKASRTRVARPPRRPVQLQEDEPGVDEGVDAFFEGTKVNREFVQVPDKPDQPKVEETPKQSTKKSSKFFGSKNKEESIDKAETKDKEKSPAKSSFLGGILGRKKGSAKDDKKEEKKEEDGPNEIQKKTVEEVPEETQPEPEPSPRKPAGAPKIGLPGMGPGMGLGGGNLLAEMAKKREARDKRASAGKSMVDGKIEVSSGSSRETTPTPKPKDEKTPVPAARQKDEKPSTPSPVAVRKERPPSTPSPLKKDEDVSTPSPVAPIRPNKPTPSPRPASIRPDAKPAITKEKPALVPPKPAVRVRKPSPNKADTSGEKVELREQKDTEEPKRLSVKDRIANLSKGGEEDSGDVTEQPKSRSLPRGLQPNFAAFRDSANERPLSMYARTSGDTSPLMAEMKLRNSRKSGTPEKELEKDEEKERASSTDSLDSAEVKVTKSEDEGEDKVDIENNNTPSEEKRISSEEGKTEETEDETSSKVKVDLDELKDEVSV